MSAEVAPRRHRRRGVGPRLVVGGLAILLLGAGLLWPVEVRNSAPFGGTSTLDARRFLAVRGGYVTPNYDGFDRVDLDLRAYDAAIRYDLTVHVRPASVVPEVEDAAEGAEPVEPVVPDPVPDLRTIALSVEAEEIWHDKAAFANTYLTLRFPEIADSAGRHYFVWVEGGPGTRDAVWTVWRIRTYSTVPAYRPVLAMIDNPPEPLRGPVGSLVMILLTAATVGSAVWLLVAVWPARGARPDRVGGDGRG